MAVRGNYAIGRFSNNDGVNMAKFGVSRAASMYGIEKVGPIVGPTGGCGGTRRSRLY